VPKPLPLLEDTSPICCAPIGAAPRLERGDAIQLAVRLKALADPVRLQLVAHLLGSPNCEACTCDLAPIVGVTEATVSHHLKQLSGSGLVTKRRDGMNVRYQLVPEAVAAISRMLDPGCC
jgi:ArsR family transcriptional regulator, arsenate/arsenite/antimonite-responsive transcriptional repressor